MADESQFNTSFELTPEEAVFFFENLSQSVKQITGRMSNDEKNKFIEVYTKLKNQVIQNSDGDSIKAYFAQKLEVNDTKTKTPRVNISLGS